MQAGNGKISDRLHLPEILRYAGRNRTRKFVPDSSLGLALQRFVELGVSSMQCRLTPDSSRTCAPTFCAVDALTITLVAMVRFTGIFIASSALLAACALAQTK